MLKRGAMWAVLLLLVWSTQVSFAQEIIGPDVYPEGVNPLTGLAVSDPSALERRPLIIKIDNYPPEIRPQSGIMSADVVWETLLAGGATRFAAIYLSQDVEQVGPVRSCRLVDFTLARVYRSLFVCSGMAQGTLDRLRADALASERAITRGGPCPPLCRFPQDGVAFEHTLFADTAGLRDLAVELGRDTNAEPLNGMAFSPDPVNAGVTIASARVQYTATEIEWRYDAGRWMRNQDGEPHTDALTGETISAANVLILEANHIEEPVVSDGYWGPPNYAFSVDLIGQGRAVLLRDGQFIEAEWRRTDALAPLRFFDSDGGILAFKPGNTFVNLVPRWSGGYQLVFDLAQPLNAEVLFSGGVYVRYGPGTGYTALGVAQQGERFRAVGRNRTGDWVQLLTADGDAVWASLTVVRVDGDVLSLPLVRSTFE